MSSVPESIYSSFSPSYPPSTASTNSLPSYDYPCLIECSYCNGKYDEDMLAEAWTEFHTTSEPCRDLRSAARANGRHRKNNHGGCNSYTCRRQEQTARRIRNKRSKRDALRDAVLESQRFETYPIRECKEYVRIKWDVELPEDVEEFTHAAIEGYRFDVEFWYIPDPYVEETQRCALVEWAGNKERSNFRRKEGIEENEIWALSRDTEACEDETWEVVSYASSETWSVVDVE